MKKRIMLFFSCVFLVVGMVGCAKEETYVRDTSKGRMIQIDLYTLDLMMEEKDTFVVAFATHTCGYCQDFSVMLSTYLMDHNIEVYFVYLDEENTSANENKKIVNKNFKEFENTPGVFYVKEGKNASYLENQEDGINEDYFDTWVQDNKIDHKEK